MTPAHPAPVTGGPDRFPLAESISALLADDLAALQVGEPNALLDAVTPTTAELLRWWFQQDYCDVRSGLNFHRGQRDAILAVIYAHEVLEAENLLDLYEKVSRESVLVDGMLGEVTAERNQHPKYAAKMATGTGKTWVLNALLVWQYLNAVAAPDDPRFTTNFLVVAPGLIVYDRLLDSFLGRLGGDGTRDFSTSDLSRFAELFIPDDRRDTVLGFVQSSVVPKAEIGRKVTGGGAIVLTNWHLLMGQDPDDPEALEDDEDDIAPGLDVDWKAAAAAALPLSPGVTAGNSLDTLDRRFERGEKFQWLLDLPSLMVFNDEAHHVHSGGKSDPSSEVEWQRSLNALAAGKGRRFVQMDFSATPYNETRGKKIWFPHIVVDFPLDVAVTSGLVKAFVLDKRQEIAALKNEDLDFAAERDERGQVVGLSEGQRVMLRAGLAKLAILEKEFADLDSDKRPKMLVVVEDTKVSEPVVEFLQSTGLAEDDILRIDSGRKQELGAKDWEPVRAKLFDVDNRPQPKVIVSVLMLREGFDVNNICVIVPLRAAGSGILAEQTVGRGLRLMWRGEPVVEELRARNLELLKQRKPPASYYDVLFVVEHPAFEALYENLIGEGVAGEIEGDSPTPGGDVERIGLKPGFEEFDFHIPFVVRSADEEMTGPRIDIGALATSTIPITDLLKVTKKGDTFISLEPASGVQFGPFRVDGAKMTAAGYNDYLRKIATRVGGAVDRSFTKAGHLKQNPDAFATLQVSGPELVGWADRYIRTRFFGGIIDPLENEQWRVLMIDDISDQIAGNLATALVASLDIEITGDPEVTYRSISEVDAIFVRETSRVDVEKCVYPTLPIPARSGGLERLFLEWADADAEVEALLKIHEYRHAFLRRPYLKADGMPAQYSPDFLVRTEFDVFVVETKAQTALTEVNVKRKAEAARGWCAQINELPPEMRGGRDWNYVLLGEKSIREWHSKGATVSQMLAYARLQPPTTSAQTALF